MQSKEGGGRRPTAPSAGLDLRDCARANATGRTRAHVSGRVPGHITPGHVMPGHVILSHIHIHIYIHTYIYIYSHTHTHSHTHTLTHTLTHCDRDVTVTGICDRASEMPRKTSAAANCGRSEAAAAPCERSSWRSGARTRRRARTHLGPLDGDAARLRVAHVPAPRAPCASLRLVIDRCTEAGSCVCAIHAACQGPKESPCGSGSAARLDAGTAYRIRTRQKTK
jgi:hypothetical protein